MGSRCVTCGYRSNAPGFFRPAATHGLGRWSKVCQGCEPYVLSKFERQVLYMAPINQIIFVGLALFMSSDRHEPLLPAFLFVEAFLLSGLFRAVVHEGGHALAAQAVGGYVWRVSLGFGPLRRRLRMGAMQIEFRRHLYAANGLMQPLAVGGGRLRAFLYIAAGALANGGAAALLFFTSYALRSAPLADITGSILSGLGLSQAFGLINLLSFQSRLTGGASDGRLILRLLRQRPSAPDAAQLALARGVSELTKGRFQTAADAFQDMASSKPNSVWAFAMVLHSLFIAGGNAEVLAFYHRHREAIEAAIANPAEGEAEFVPILQANIASVAADAARPDDRALSDRWSRAAIDTAPNNSAALGARGAVLLGQGDIIVAHELLLKAIRRTEPGSDRADLAQLLAQAARAQGDQTAAETFEDLRRYVLRVAA